MIKTAIYLPEANNDGQPFLDSVWAEVQHRLVAAFGGFTTQAGLSGTWVARGGRVYSDRNIAYYVSVGVRQLPEWVAFAEWALAAFEQEAMYVEVAGTPEVLEASGGP